MIGHEKMQHVVFGRFAIPRYKGLMVTCGRHERLPLFDSAARKIEREVQIDFDKTRVIFCTLNIPIKPLNGTRHSAQHRIVRIRRLQRRRPAVRVEATAAVELMTTPTYLYCRHLATN